ncbi:CHAD domain-containing protein [Vibrio sp. YIC-376]|uniref:CHAD domain-containing protein n=1 Tax=Vibrio sp. YIC-376 TaxID=3136162 RepID=UPI00402AE4D9
MFRKSAARLPLYFDSDLCFVLPNFLLSEFNYVKSLERGLSLGQDPECNHQYRVTLRRIRSVSLLLKDILSPFEQKIIKPHLKVLMKQTNLLRDLDVFIIDKPRYMTMIPEHKASLESVFAVIETRQYNEQQRVSHWLKSRAYRSATVIVENSLLRAQHYELRTKPLSPLQYANNKILNQFQKVSRASKKVTEFSEDKIIHSLRIKCKSLRYLLECFSALYSADQHKENVKHLKFLQDQLGDFNDTSTQIDFFTHLRKTSMSQKADRKALKDLTKVIKHQHGKSRQSILVHITQFDQFLQETSALEVYRS